MKVILAVNEAVPEAVTPTLVLAPGLSVPATGLTVMWPPPVLSAADQCTVVP